MKVFELLEQNQPAPPEPPPTSPEEEDDPQGKFDAEKVDGNLQQTAQDINDEQAQPEPPAEEPPPELNDQNVKPIDAALLSQIKALPYTKKYDFDDSSPLNPMKVAAMSMEDLSYLQAKVRYKMQMITMRDQVGMEDDKTMEFCTDLTRFVNTVMQFKKTGTKMQLAQTQPSPPYQQQT